MIYSLINFLVQVNGRDLFSCSETFCIESWLGDGYCDEACMNPACNYDSPVYSSSSLDTFYSSDCFSNCKCDKGLLGNKQCNQECNNYMCGWDLGDCGYCASGCTKEMLKNDQCDTECSNIQCMYDNNGCGWCSAGCYLNDLNSTTCKNECGSGYCYYFSSNPCLSVGCSIGCTSNMIGDRSCDLNCYNEACQYDGGDCDCATGCGVTQMQETTCKKTNGVIDDPCAVQSCYFKNYVCGYCSKGCFYENLGDGVCQEDCNVFECNYDYGDCNCAPGCPYKYDQALKTFTGSGSDQCSPNCLVSSCHFAVDFCTDKDMLLLGILNYLVYRNTRFVSTSDCGCSKKQDYYKLNGQCSEYDSANECTWEQCFYCMGSTSKVNAACKRSSFDSCLICSTSMVLSFCDNKLAKCPTGYMDVHGLTDFFSISHWCLPEPINYSPSRIKSVYVDSDALDKGNGEKLTPYDSIYRALVNVYASFTKIFIVSPNNELVVDDETSSLVSDIFDPLNTKSTESFYELWIIGSPAVGDMVTVSYKSKMIISPQAQKVFIQNIKFVGTQVMKVDCSEEICSYCPYYSAYSGHYYNDREEKIEDWKFERYSTNCSLYSNLNFFVFTTNVTLSNVKFFNFRSQYNSLIKSSGVLTLINVTFERLQAKPAGSVILMSCISQCNSSVFSYDSGAVQKLGAGYDDSENVATGSFFKAFGIDSISIKNVNFSFNFVLNNLKSVNSAYLIYSLNHLGKIEITDCQFVYNLVNYLVYVDVISLDYTQPRIEFLVNQDIAQQHFLMQNLEIDNLYCSKGLFYYSMLKVLHNIKVSNVSIENAVVGESGFFFIQNLGTVSSIEEEGEYQKIIINKNKTEIYYPARYLKMNDITIKGANTGSHILYLQSYSNCYFENFTFISISDGSSVNISKIIKKFSDTGEYLSNIDTDNEVPELNCNDLVSISKISKLSMNNIILSEASCISGLSSTGLVLSSISYLELNNTEMSQINSCTSQGSALDIKSSTDVFITNLDLDNISNMLYSTVQFDLCSNIEISNFKANQLTSNYSAPVVISKVATFNMSNFSLTALKTEFSNGGCISVLTPVSESSVDLRSGVFNNCVSANGKGGGIYLDAMTTESSNKLFLDELNFSQCRANEGAALFISSMNTFKATFSNSIQNLKIEKCFCGQGGVVADYHTNGLLHFNYVYMNNNSGNHAGFMAFFSSTLPRLKIENAQILNSESNDPLLSFRSLQSFAYVELKSVKVVNVNVNSAIDPVSSIFVSRIFLNTSDLTIMNVGAGIEATSNSSLVANNLVIKNCSSIGVSVSFSSAFTCSSCRFEENRFTVLYVEENSVSTVDQSYFLNNQAESVPMFFFNLCKNKLSKISNSEISKNYVYAESLAYVSQSNLGLSNTTVSSNTVQSNDFSGFYTFKSSLNISQSSFFNMSSEIKGSFIYSVTTSTVRLEASTFKQGSSSEGNIYIKDSELTVTDCVFDSNSGGDANIESSSLTMKNSVVKNPILGESDDWGSVILTETTAIEIKNSSFLNPSQKSLKLMQSLIYLDTCNSFILQDSTFRGSSAISMGLYLKNSESTTIQNSLFEHFTASPYSAMTAVTDKQKLPLSITDSVFQNNTSTDNGGGLYVDSYNLTMANCQVLNNFANLSGGGIFYETSKCETCGIYLSGASKIIQNSCNQDGGAIKWSHFKPAYNKSEVVIQNNSAYYGNDLATVPAALSFSNGRLLSQTITQISGMAPGQEFKEKIIVNIKDTYQQIVKTDSSTSLTMSVNTTQQGYSVSGTTSFVAIEGVITMTNFTPSGPPGSTLILKLDSSIEASKARNDDSVYESTAYMNVTFRECVNGEQIGEASCTVCQEGKYLFHPASSCKPCPTGATCKGGESLVINDGYWRSDLDSEVIYSCEYSAACIGGTEDDPLGYCATGYAGVKCQSCEVGYTMNSNYKCAKCPGRAANIAILIALTIGIIFIAVVLVKTTLKSAFTPKAMHSIYIKIFTNYLQLIFITTQFNLQWPSYVKHLFSIQQGAATVSDQIFSVDCYLDENNSNDRSQGYYFKICIMAGMPFGIFLLSYLFWIFYSFIITSFKPLNREVYTTIIVLFFLVYPNIVKILFAHFNCMDIDHMDSYLKSNTEVVCWSEKHKKFSFMVVIPGIILWAVGFPGLLVLIMAKKKKSLHLDKNRVIFGYLFNGYKLSRFFWEFVIMYRKILLISISVFLSSQAVIIQALTVVIVLVPSLYVQYSSRPYNSHELNHMETEALFTATITIYCGLYYLSDSIGEELKVLLFVVIILGNAYFILFWVYYMMQALFDMFIKIFPQFRAKFKRGDAFEESFNEEILVQAGVCHNKLEGRKTYTFFNGGQSNNEGSVKFDHLDDAFAGVLIKEIEDYINGNDNDWID